MTSALDITRRGPPALAALALAGCAQLAHAEPLPAWNASPSKQAIIDFVRQTTDATSPHYVPPAERIATIDQDGTLWVKQPKHAQVTNAPGARLRMIVLHDDAQRELAYGPAAGQPASRVGSFTQPVYDQARASGWTVISIKNDWKRGFAFD